MIKQLRTGENLKPYSSADIRFTTKDGPLYAFVLTPPTGDILIKTLATGGLLDSEIENVALLGSSETLHWSRSPKGLIIQLWKTLPAQPVSCFRITVK